MPLVGAAIDIGQEQLQSIVGPSAAAAEVAQSALRWPPGGRGHGHSRATFCAEPGRCMSRRGQHQIKGAPACAAAGAHPAASSMSSKPDTGSRSFSPRPRLPACHCHCRPAARVGGARPRGVQPAAVTQFTAVSSRWQAIRTPLVRLNWQPPSTRCADGEQEACRGSQVWLF